MTRLVFGFIILAGGFLVLIGAAGLRARGPSAGAPSAAPWASACWPSARSSS